MAGTATCARCGASFAGGVARCPFCGASVDGPTLPAEPPPRLAPPAPLAPPPDLVPPPARISARTRPQPPAKRKPNWVLPAAAAGILSTGALAILLIGKSSPAPTEAPLAASVASTSPLSAESAPPARAESFADPARVDPSDLYPKVKQRAIAWNADARLVSIAASPVVGDKVDLTQGGGEIVYVFAADTSARTPPFGQLQVTVRRGGIEQAATGEPNKPANARRAGTTPSVKVVEPNCVFDAAAKAAHASGVPPAAVMKLRYEADAASKRGVWTARVQGKRELDRVIDGQTCAIVVHR